jgi:hypothetical protein
MYRKGKDIRKRVIKLLFSLFLLFFVEKFPIAEFRMISAETSCWEVERE